MKKVLVYFAALAVSIAIFVVGRLVPSLSYLREAGAVLVPVLFVGGLLWLLVAILVSGRKTKDIGPYHDETRCLGLLTLDSGALVLTDDAFCLKRNVEIIRGVPSGEYRVMLTSREYDNGDVEWVALRILLEGTAEATETISRDLVTDSCLLVLACSSILDWPQFSEMCKQRTKGWDRGAAFVRILEGPDHKQRAVFLAPPGGEGSYPLTAHIGPHSADVTIDFMPDEQ